jgi:hypothetical protein
MIHNPSIITYHYLHFWLHGNLVHIDFDFNFEHFNNDFQICMDKMLDRFMNGNLSDDNLLIIDYTYLLLARWSRFMIFITTHSNPNTGYIHVAPEN